MPRRPRPHLERRAHHRIPRVGRDVQRREALPHDARHVVGREVGVVPLGDARVRVPELRVDSDRRVCVIVETIREGRVSAASTEVCSP